MDMTDVLFFSLVLAIVPTLFPWSRNKPPVVKPVVRDLSNCRCFWCSN